MFLSVSCNGLTEEKPLTSSHLKHSEPEPNQFIVCFWNSKSIQNRKDCFFKSRNWTNLRTFATSLSVRLSALSSHVSLWIVGGPWQGGARCPWWHIIVLVAQANVNHRYFPCNIRRMYHLTCTTDGAGHEWTHGYFPTSQLWHCDVCKKPYLRIRPPILSALLGLLLVPKFEMNMQYRKHFFLL